MPAMVSISSGSPARPRRPAAVLAHAARRVGAVALVLVYLAWPSLAAAAPPESPGAQPAQRGDFSIVIDAGHGGSDPGTISQFLPLQEKDVVLRLALQTGAALQRRGVPVIYTRTEDRLVPLEQRAALARSRGAAALLSLHLNAAPDPNANGAEAWFGSADGGDTLAAAVLGALAGPLQDAGLAVRGTRPGSFLAVLKAPVPSALVEVGYISNARDAAALKRPAFLAAAAEAIATGVVAFRDRPQASGGTSATQLRRSSALAPSGLYFVRPGETVQAIAVQLGVPSDLLARLNPATLTQPLLPGQPLRVDDDTAAGASAGTRPGGSARPAAGGAASGATYTVAPGDTLSAIASRTGRSTADLIRVNGLRDPDLVIVGQRLVLGPEAAAAGTSGGRSGTASAGGGGGTRYTVQRGDTLSEIAERLGVSVAALGLANGIGQPDEIRFGTVLTIPPRA